jgi:hypothetical protein
MKPTSREPLSIGHTTEEFHHSHLVKLGLIDGRSLYPKFAVIAYLSSFAFFDHCFASFLNPIVIFKLCCRYELMVRSPVLERLQA